MKFNGTKGKWAFLENPIPRNKKSPEFLIKSEDRYLGSVWSQEMEIEEAQANAKLISCAPEMLSVLIQTLDWLKNDQEYGLRNPYLKDIQEAIQKATE
jgi:hypothetical protein